MSKVILVMDAPNKCWDCPCYTGYIDCDKCKAVMEDLTYKKLTYSNVWEKRPDWCPLKEFPNEKEKTMDMSLMEMSEVDGYNACLKYINRK